MLMDFMIPMQSIFKWRKQKHEYDVDIFESLSLHSLAIDFVIGAYHGILPRNN